MLLSRGMLFCPGPEGREQEGAGAAPEQAFPPAVQPQRPDGSGRPMEGSHGRAAGQAFRPLCGSDRGGCPDVGRDTDHEGDPQFGCAAGCSVFGIEREKGDCRGASGLPEEFRPSDRGLADSARQGSGVATRHIRTG